MVRRLRTLNTVVVAALATAGIAAAAGGDAWPCHPDLPGTRSLTVTGAVTGYRFAGRGTLVASVQTKRCAGVARWNYAASPQATASVSCRGSNAAGPARRRNSWSRRRATAWFESCSRPTASTDLTGSMSSRERRAAGSRHGR